MNNKLNLSNLIYLPKKLILHEHQKLLCNFLIKNKDSKGILVFHSTGSGKTITSIISIHCLFSINPKISTIIITTSSIFKQFENELKKLKMFEQYPNKISLMSYNKFFNSLKKGLIDCKNKNLIIDEAHNFTNFKSARSKQLLECTKLSNKTLLLTATPLRNNINEIINLMEMITTYTRNEIKELLYGSTEQFNKLFNCNISMYEFNKNNINYAKPRFHTKYFYMSPSYYSDYFKIQENNKSNIINLYQSSTDLMAFYNGIRRAVNLASTIEESPKIAWTINKIKQNLFNNKKVLVYSSWKNTGINLIKNKLDKLNIPYVSISGDIKPSLRQNLIDKYNNGSIKIMLITSAASEGISLKETRTVIILEPYWNNEKINQIIGRAIRFKSHKNLLPKDRKVDIYLLILKKPKDIPNKKDKLISADELLYAFSTKKSNAINFFYKKITPLSIENNPRCKK